MGAIFSSFATWLETWITYILQYVVGIVYGIFAVLSGFLQYIMLKVENSGFDMVTSLLDGTGIAHYIQVINTAFVGPLGYFANAFMLPAAATALVSCYLARFLIRRLPFIG